MEACWSYLVPSSQDLRGPYCSSCINKRHLFKIDQLQRRKDLVLYIHLTERPEKRDYWKLQLDNGSISPFTFAKENLPTNLAAINCGDLQCDYQTTKIFEAELQNKLKETKEKYAQTTTKQKNQLTQTTPFKYINRESQTAQVNTPSLSNEIIKTQSADSTQIKKSSTTSVQSSKTSDKNSSTDSRTEANNRANMETPPFYNRSAKVVHPLNMSNSVITRLQALASTKVSLATTSEKLRERYPVFAKQIATSRPEKKCLECNTKFSGFQPSVEHVFSAKHLYLLNRDGNAFDQADFTFIMDLCGVKVNANISMESTPNRIIPRAPFHMPRLRDDITLNSPMVFDENQRTSLARMFAEKQYFQLLADAYTEKYGSMLQEYQWKICQLCSIQVPNMFLHVQHVLSARHFNQAAEKQMTFDESEMMSVKKLLFSVQETQKKSQTKSSGAASTSSSTNDLPSVLFYVNTKEKSPSLNQPLSREAKISSSSNTLDRESSAPKTIPKAKKKTAKETAAHVNGHSTNKKTAIGKEKCADSAATSQTPEKVGPQAMFTEKQIRSLRNIPLMYGTTNALDGVNKEELQKHIDLIGHELTKFSAETDFERLRDAFEVRGWTTKKCMFCVKDLDADYLCHVIKASHQKHMNDKGYYHLKKDLQAILGVMIQTYDAIEEANRPPLPFFNGTRDPTKKIDDSLLMTNIRSFRKKLKEYMPEVVEGVLEEQYRRIEFCKMCKFALTSRNRLEHFISEDHIESMLAKDRYFSKWDVYTMGDIMLKLAVEDSKIRFKKVSSSQAEIGDDALAWTTEQLDQPPTSINSLRTGAQTQKNSTVVTESKPAAQQNVASSSFGSSIPERVRDTSHTTSSTSNHGRTVQPTPVPRSSLNSTMNERKRNELERQRLQQAEKTHTLPKQKDSCTIS